MNRVLCSIIPVSKFIVDFDGKGLVADVSVIGELTQVSDDSDEVGFAIRFPEVGEVVFVPAGEITVYGEVIGTNFCSRSEHASYNDVKATIYNTQL